MEALLARHQHIGQRNPTLKFDYNVPSGQPTAALTGIGTMVQVFVAKMRDSPICSSKIFLAYATPIYTPSFGIGKLDEQYEQHRSTSVWISWFHFMHTPPGRLLELVKYHAVLASGSHRMAAGVGVAVLAMRGGVRESGTITEPNGSGIMGDRRVLGKMGLILAV